SEHQLAEVTNRILDTLQDAWNNLAFSSEFSGFQSEGTYVNNIVLPTIRATLKDFPLENQLLSAVPKSRVARVQIEEVKDDQVGDQI
ncbi:6475_t:CDS:2, partial [Diversispora eburnea]